MQQPNDNTGSHKRGTTDTQRKNKAQRIFLKNLFPKLFDGDFPLPMKAGIKDDMLTHFVRSGIDISEERLQASLRSCCSSIVYKTRVMNMRFRRGINGEPVEKISKEDKKHARTSINKYRVLTGAAPLKSPKKISVLKKSKQKAGK